MKAFIELGRLAESHREAIAEIIMDFGTYEIYTMDDVNEYADKIINLLKGEK